jgi:hypothetical protein
VFRSITVAGALACGAMLTGCAADTTTLDTSNQGATPAEQAEVAAPSFMIWVRGDTTPETAIPAILAAAHDQLAVACAGKPGTSVRIHNPFLSEAYADVLCSTFLDGTGEANSALTSDVDGPIGTVQQNWSPFGLACSALMFGASLAWNWPWGQEGCNAPGAHNPTACRALTGIGVGGLGLLCAFI